VFSKGEENVAGTVCSPYPSPAAPADPSGNCRGVSIRLLLPDSSHPCYGTAGSLRRPWYGPWSSGLTAIVANT
jgi:hypothetical protein